MNTERDPASGKQEVCASTWTEFTQTSSNHIFIWLHILPCDFFFFYKPTNLTANFKRVQGLHLLLNWMNGSLVRASPLHPPHPFPTTLCEKQESRNCSTLFALYGENGSA